MSAVPECAALTLELGEAVPPVRALCVDDNPDNADTTAALLRAMGLVAEACYSGTSALQLNDTFRPDVCFLDLNMPGMDGDELAVELRRVRRWRPKILVAVTAMSDGDSRRRLAAAAFDVYLVKPVSLEKLDATVMLIHRVIDSYADGDAG